MKSPMFTRVAHGSLWIFGQRTKSDWEIYIQIRIKYAGWYIISDWNSMSGVLYVTNLTYEPCWSILLLTKSSSILLSILMTKYSFDLHEPP